ncbi:hypothetical protein [Kitasatospora phosalacinea]|uniref:hypothetical protein n=1 Tax=Kitasatospora phosalacinea TaxID=2065 RepID=UPI0018FE163C|nr:hypothetical protein [Kitasatospora phosalacinea]
MAAHGQDAAPVGAFGDLAEELLGAGASGGEPAVQVGLERADQPLLAGAELPCRCEEFVQMGDLEAADGLAVEPRAAGDGADRPLLLQRAVDVRVAVAGAFDDRGPGQLENRQLDCRRPGRHFLVAVFAQAGAVLTYTV